MIGVRGAFAGEKLTTYATDATPSSARVDPEHTGRPPGWRAGCRTVEPPHLDDLIDSPEISVHCRSLSMYSLQLRQTPELAGSAVRTALLPRRSSPRRTADNRRPSRRCQALSDADAARLAGEPAGGDRVCPSLAEPARAGLTDAANCGPRSGRPVSRRRLGWLDLVTWCLDLGTAEVDTCRHQVPRCRHRCLHLGTACRSQ